MISGIYKITNKINGHYYIGQAADFKSRMRGHKNSSLDKTNKDYNSPIHRTIRKYGWDNFEKEIIEECPREELNKREIYWIEILKARENGNYNLLPGGQCGGYGFEEKPVELYDLNGKYIKTISSATKVAEELNISRSSVYGVLHKERPTCKGYQLKYQDDPSIITAFKSRQGGTIQVCQIDLKTGNIIKVYISAAEAARANGADASSIIKVCKGKLKIHKGYKWKYYKELEDIQ